MVQSGCFHPIDVAKGNAALDCAELGPNLNFGLACVAICFVTIFDKTIPYRQAGIWCLGIILMLVAALELSTWQTLFCTSMYWRFNSRLAVTTLSADLIPSGLCLYHKIPVSRDSGWNLAFSGILAIRHPVHRQALPHCCTRWRIHSVTNFITICYLDRHCLPGAWAFLGMYARRWSSSSRTQTNQWVGENLLESLIYTSTSLVSSYPLS